MGSDSTPPPLPPIEDLDIHVLDGWTKTHQHAPSMKTEWFKKDHIRKHLTQNGEPQRSSWGTQKQKKALLTSFWSQLKMASQRSKGAHALYSTSQDLPIGCPRNWKCWLLVENGPFSATMVERRPLSVSGPVSTSPRWPRGKASASRAEDPGFESRLRRDFFGVESYQWLQQWLPCQAPGVIGSALGLVGPVSVYCDWVRWKVWSATSISVWQHVKLCEQIRPWDTLACCWDVKQPTNNNPVSFRQVMNAVRLSLICFTQKIPQAPQHLSASALPAAVGLWRLSVKLVSFRLVTVRVGRHNYQE